MRFLLVFESIVVQGEQVYPIASQINMRELLAACLAVKPLFKTSSHATLAL